MATLFTFSISRRTQFRFGTGSTVFSADPQASNEVVGPSQQHYRFLGWADLDHQMWRTWSAHLEYEHGLGFIDGFIMLKDGPGKEQNAYDFIDAWLAPESGKYMIESVGYGHSNRKAFDLASAESKAALGLGAPDKLLTSSIFLQEIDPDRRAKYVKMFEDVKAGF